MCGHRCIDSFRSCNFERNSCNFGCDPQPTQMKLLLALVRRIGLVMVKAQRQQYDQYRVAEGRRHRNYQAKCQFSHGIVQDHQFSHRARLL